MSEWWEDRADDFMRELRAELTLTKAQELWLEREVANFAEDVSDPKTCAECMEDFK